MNRYLPPLLLISMTLFIHPVCAEDSGKSIGSAANKTWDGVTEGAREVWDGVSEGSKEAWEATKEGSKEVWDATKEGSREAWEATKQGANNLRKKVGDTISGE